MFLVSKAFPRSASSRWICQSCQRRLTSSGAASRTSRSSASSKASKLPDSPARTRFAPSPTGYLHLGSLRTALFNYLLAKSTGGQFLLRIEDTDQKRTIPDAESRLFEDLDWAGLNWDEGPNVGGPYGPYKQSQRTALYRNHAEILLRSGHAYRCFCSPERLHALAKQRTELGLPTDYDRTCIHVPPEVSEDRAAKGEAHVIRLRMPSTSPIFIDLVYGKVRTRRDQSRKASLYPTFEDPILLKSDGFPTYHLANVVDDHHMKITHVVRGAEWMSSTPKHLVMYNAFNWEAPAFAHVGLLMDQNRQKLSKRNMDLDISTFRGGMGIFPETLMNFVALLGWSHSQQKDIMSLQELIENFNMKFTTGDTVVTFDKLWYLQRAHADRFARSDIGTNTGKLSLLTTPIIEVLKRRNLVNEKGFVLNHHIVDDYLPKLLRADARNYTNASAFIERNKYFFKAPDRADLLQCWPSLSLHGIPAGLRNSVSTEDLDTVLSLLESISNEDWTAERLRKCINNDVIQVKTATTLHDFIDSGEIDLDMTRNQVTKAWSKLIHKYIRWVIAVGLPGPDASESMQILGREETLARFAKAAEVLATSGLNDIEAKGVEEGKLGSSV